MSVDAGDGPPLLLVGCSRKKSPRVRRGRAWDVYDGPLFQVLKKALRERPGWEAAVAVLIVSARHGVIGPDRVIATYDERLTVGTAQPARRPLARQLRAAVDRPVVQSGPREPRARLPGRPARPRRTVRPDPAGVGRVRDRRPQRTDEAVAPGAVERPGHAAQRWNGRATVAPSMISKR